MIVVKQDMSAWKDPEKVLEDWFAGIERNKDILMDLMKNKELWADLERIAREYDEEQ